MNLRPDSQKKVLVLGDGGREHALAWAVSRSESVSKVFVGPGNGGTTWPPGTGEGLQPSAPCERVVLSPLDFESVLAFVERAGIYLTIVGDGEPLDRGIVDAFRAKKQRVFGPSSAAAKIESSKSFAKTLMRDINVPTAEFQIFDSFDAARQYVLAAEPPLVVKADGLAGGKGSFVCQDHTQAQDALYQIMKKRRFGGSGDRVVIEEFLEGKEVSFFAFVHGENVRPFVAARDYKKIYDGDKGPNTGGVGAIAPVDLDATQVADIIDCIVKPVAAELCRRSMPYQGILYAALILTNQGVKVLEFNCRFGDPESQAMLPLLKSDFFQMIDLATDGQINDAEIVWSGEKSVTVALCSSGYPQMYNPGLPIKISPGMAQPHSYVFHAGTDYAKGQLMTSAGRIFGITSVGASFAEAARRSYSLTKHVEFDGMYFRKDIGLLT